ncbi:MAG TPA: LPS export ABC transporter ATP-binding protein [Planctomycetota bacterium]|nr:LPS export ABC transporter ATP-binding protein [Planctomycetota bacterium]
MDEPTPDSARATQVEDQSAILETEGLRKIYRRRAVVDGVSFSVSPGEIVGLLGPNGAGKTTSFRMTVGMIAPTAGRVRFLGEDVTRLPMFRRARLGMGYLAQEPSVFRRMTVEQNVLAILETMDLRRRERRTKCEAVLEQLGLTRVRTSVAETLSGGERRRLEVARSLARGPKLLLLDEPFVGIDPIAVQDIQQLLRELRSQGIAILITDHNVRETLSITDRSYILVEGKILRHGEARTLVEDPEVRQLYLGEGFRFEPAEGASSSSATGGPA